MKLSEFFNTHNKVAVALSGGVDSAFLLFAAVSCGAQVAAYYVKTAFQPQFELDDAKRTADSLHVELRVINVDVLSHGDVTQNTESRCYYCKKVIFSAIAKAAQQDGFSTILDGTNASDDISLRPGVKALAELGVLSPLRECGITKDEIRRLSREAELFTWDKPAYACLATRIPEGTAITASALERVERAENYLSSLGFSDFRVRLLGDTAKIQVTSAQIAKVIEEREKIVAQLKQFCSGVLLDLEVRQ